MEREPPGRKVGDMDTCRCVGHWLGSPIELSWLLERFNLEAPLRKDQQRFPLHPLRGLNFQELCVIFRGDSPRFLQEFGHLLPFQFGRGRCARRHGYADFLEEPVIPSR